MQYFCTDFSMQETTMHVQNTTTRAFEAHLGRFPEEKEYHIYCSHVINILYCTPKHRKLLYQLHG